MLNSQYLRKHEYQYNNNFWMIFSFVEFCNILKTEDREEFSSPQSSKEQYPV